MLDHILYNSHATVPLHKIVLEPSTPSFVFTKANCPTFLHTKYCALRAFFINTLRAGYQDKNVGALLNPSCFAGSEGGTATAPCLGSFGKARVVCSELFLLRLPGLELGHGLAVSDSGKCFMLSPDTMLV